MGHSGSQGNQYIRITNRWDTPVVYLAITGVYMYVCVCVYVDYVSWFSNVYLLREYVCFNRAN